MLPKGVFEFLKFKVCTQKVCSAGILDASVFLTINGSSLIYKGFL